MNPFILQNIIPKVSGSGLLPYTGPELFGWWDPSDSLNVTKSGGRFDQVNDKSGNGNHLIGSGSLRPYTGRFINGNEVLDCQLSAMSCNINIFQPLTIVLLYKQDIDNGFMTALGGNNTASRIYIATRHSSGYIQINAGLSGLSDTQSGTNINIIHISINGLSTSLYLNGVLTFSGDIGNKYISNIIIGSIDGAASLPFDGMIGQVLLYNDVINNNKLNQTRQYLANKYGISYTDIT